MNKTALKNFAIYSREKLIKDIEDKARLIGISEEGIADPLPQSTKDMKIFNIGEKDTYRIEGGDVKRYEKLVKEIEKRQEEDDYKTAYTTLVEEIAYIWFNRIIAIRFMEVNNYMPDKLRILSSGREGVREPEFVSRYRDTDIGISEEEFERLDRLKLDGSNKAMEELFQFLFIKQSNALNKQLPELFEKTDDYAELLVNISYEDPQGVIAKLIEDIGEEPFDISETGQIEIIGWLYQYYNTVPKEEVDASKKKVDKNTLPAKTQLFTPEWIVKYMVENSLGRLWIERKIAIGNDKTEEELAKEYGWKYYLPEAEQVEVVKIELKDLREDRKDLKIEDIKFMDPSMGSGHILAYAFEVFMQFYLEEGYMERQAAESIIENNLYGLDIDKRAYQLAYFALMMKGRQYSRRILNKEIKDNLYYFIDSKDINLKQIDFLGGNIKDEKSRRKIKEDILEIVEFFKNGRELGSVIKIDKDYNFDALTNFTKNINSKDILPMELIGIENTQEDIIHILRLLEILSSKYNVVVTNPPYLGRGHMGVNLTKYLDKEYKDTKADLFAVFMEKGLEITKNLGYTSMVTMQSWMFLSSYERMRKEMLRNTTTINLIHMENMVMKIAFGTSAFTMMKKDLNNYKGTYNQIKLENIKQDVPKYFPIKENRYNEVNEDNFELIPGSPIAYWAHPNLLKAFEDGKPMNSIVQPRQGLATANNNRFLKKWYEVDFNKIYFNADSIESSVESKAKWFPYNKGGSRRQWYGNYDYIVNWENDGFEIRNFKDDKGRVRSRPQNTGFYFKESITWPLITSGGFSIRYRERGSIHDVSGMSAFTNDHNKLIYLLGLMSTKISDYIFKILNPTINLQIGDFNNFTVLESQDDKIINIVEETIKLAKIDWNSYEEAWDFEIHPLLDINKQNQAPNTIEEAYKNYKHCTNNNFNQLKENEEKLNEIFIKIYGLEDVLDKYVSDKEITIAKIFDHKDDIYDDIKGNAYILTKDHVIKSFISYGVGCIFGRYSLDEEGLVYAGGEFDIERYKKIKPVEDNIVLITDKEYFEDDLANRFVDFVRVSFGPENLEDNLNFIGESLKGNGTSRQKIRNYFVNDFYKDHVKTYKKTPIYWLYDSSAGKTKRQSQDGFKALIYMHRYNADTTGKVRIDYLHRIQRMYESRMDFLRDDIAHNKDAKKVAESEKELEKIIKQVKECKDYDEKIGHIALSRIDIDLDDGVKVNYEKVQTDDKGKKFKILAKI
ncbi:MAG: BREX-1 system adenine-specific DNA-methyltransferase PglX [Tissierella sp.]|uniref:BREX-1 system adenine-specific DNA-methyltransferase PglX n=1 Tax=Tissierella sp. TaxID=41274 RepID=UPI003F99BC3F